MLTKLSSKTTMQTKEVSERTAQITCYGYCVTYCRNFPAESVAMNLDGYEWIGY